MNRTTCLLQVLLAVVATAPLRGAEIPGLPPPAPPRPFSVPAPAEKRLSNGLQVVVAERPGLPLVSAELVVRSGAESDPPELAGAMSLAAGLLTQGTSTRSATEIAAQIESLGATLSAEAGWESTTVRLATLSANAGPAFELLADVTRRPKFEAAELDRLKRQSMDDLKLALEEPGEVARAVARRLVFGDSPYGHPPAGTVASLPRITREAVASRHAHTFIPKNAALVIAGHLTAPEGFALAEKVFGDWDGPDPVDHPPAPSGLPISPRAVLIDMPEAGQAAVSVTRIAPARGAPGFAAGEMANGVLGGGYSSRLNQEIRVKRGLSYGARSVLATRRTTGQFVAACQTKHESAAEVVRVILDEIQALGAAPASPEYFAARQAVVRGDFGRGMETNAGVAGTLAELAAAGLPVADITRRVTAIEAVTPDAARAWAATHLAPGTLNIVVAGRASDIEKPLKAQFPALEVIPLSRLNFDSAALLRAKAP